MQKRDFFFKKKVLIVHHSAKSLVFLFLSTILLPAKGSSPNHIQSKKAKREKKKQVMDNITVTA